MMIKTRSVEHFLENLEGQDIFNKTVHVDTTRNPMNSDGSVFDVTLHASAVLVYPEGGEALLLCGVDCGRDRETKDGEKEGTDWMGRWIDLIKEFCMNHGLVVKPGILDA